MSSGSYKMVHARCPFFRLMEGHQVTCEGLIDDSVIQLKFHRKSDWEIQTDNYCCGKYQCCEVYRMLMDAKYPEED